MTPDGRVRWGIIGTANIARASFLPGLRQAGDVAAAVAGRDAERAGKWARDHGVDRAVHGYQALIEDPEIDALYLPLPNALHAEWTIRALQAGKPVLCEKPLCGTLPDTERVLEVARRTGTLLWEAFVFPFHAQMQRIRDLVTGGAIGELVEIRSGFHFALSNPANIRYSPDLQGGALNDVGCYPVRLAQEFFGPEHETAWARATWGGQGVDVDTWGVLGYPGGRRLQLSCGMARQLDTFSTLDGTGGQIRITNPFHPGPADLFQVITGRSEPRSFAAAPRDLPFSPAIRHIGAVLRGEETPRAQAVDTSLPTARALADLAASLPGRPDPVRGPGQPG
ncbi:MAG: dTDP-3,4-didehydro-2,6-dideoxy-alpha-D-glucose 3-reductase [Streptosporangiaceae bacterium]|nr:dTDP-3,4-didehydro-2,6-dideoxy-alpha-D-glucose 3-reductase [Streptosporangiaceae bacterium]